MAWTLAEKQPFGPLKNLANWTAATFCAIQAARRIHRQSKKLAKIPSFMLLWERKQSSWKVLAKILDAKILDAGGLQARQSSPPKILAKTLRVGGTLVVM